MSKQALKRVRRAVNLPVCREPLPAYAWPGGYPLFYIFADGGACCAACANANLAQIDEDTRAHASVPGAGYRRNSHGGWALAGFDVNWEDADMTCDHCSQPIETAYAD